MCVCICVCVLRVCMHVRVHSHLHVCIPVCMLVEARSQCQVSSSIANPPPHFLTQGPSLSQAHQLIWSDWQVGSRILHLPRADVKGHTTTQLLHMCWIPELRSPRSYGKIFTDRTVSLAPLSSFTGVTRAQLLFVCEEERGSSDSTEGEEEDGSCGCQAQCSGTQCHHVCLSPGRAVSEHSRRAELPLLQLTQN